jgi:hypothetical protein
MHVNRTILANKVRTIAEADCPAPQCQPATYASLITLAGAYLLPRVAPREARNIAEALHAAYQLGHIAGVKAERDHAGPLLAAVFQAEAQAS